MCTFQIPGTKKLLINENDVIGIVADGRGCDFYVITNVQKKEWVRIDSSHNIGHYKKLLVNSPLFDAHKKYIVNIEQVAAYDGNYILEMKIYIPKVLKVAKRKRKLFKERLNNSRSLLK